jgi:hypothetical protein
VRNKMKKTTVALVVIAGVTLVGVIGVASVASVYAQTTGQDPTATPDPWTALGMGHMWGNAAGAEGPLHDYIVAAFADASGLSTSEVEDRLAAGETLSTIAQDQGLSLDEFRTLMGEVRQTAIESAESDGVLTQEQTQSMLRLMNGTGPNPDRGVGANDECPMWGDASDAGAHLGGMGLSGTRGGNGFQRP